MSTSTSMSRVSVQVQVWVWVRVWVQVWVWVWVQIYCWQKTKNKVVAWLNMEDKEEIIQLKVQRSKLKTRITSLSKQLSP